MVGDQFLPATLAQWIGLIAETITLAVFVGGALWKLGITPLRSEINGLGDRLNKQEQSCAAHDAQLAQVEKGQEMDAFYRNAHSERMGLLQAMLDRIEQRLEAQRDATSREDTQTAVRLAALEVKVDAVRSSIEHLRPARGTL